MSSSIPVGGAPPVLPRFDNTLGSLLVGGLVAMAARRLWGVTCVQTWNYFTRGNKDLIRLLDTFDSALNGHILYFYMVSNYLNPMAVYKPVCFKIETFPELQTIAPLMYLTFAVGTGSDLSLALALSWLLYGSRTGFRRTDSLIKVLTLYTVNTGMIVASAWIEGFYLLLSKRKNPRLIWLTVELTVQLFFLVYVNAYLATLNAREALRDQQDMVSMNLTSLSPSRMFSDIENISPTILEKTTGTSHTESGRMAISIQTLLDKQIESKNSPSVMSMVHPTQEHLPHAL
ncbi:hypothetical protein CVT25_012464 [Psilocybe cyanescens]|uniref:DUF6534 domain-containing protein n=1 Tax=Psilocybe cyanescens TaxID=93625 RepID=A0A409XHC4_PSICY|nr:hypothetical protein CVT25_012464 [Psilocybe cyanescens]